MQKAYIGKYRPQKKIESEIQTPPMVAKTNSGLKIMKVEIQNTKAYAAKYLQKFCAEIQFNFPLINININIKSLCSKKSSKYTVSVTRTLSLNN